MLQFCCEILQLFSKLRNGNNNVARLSRFRNFWSLLRLSFGVICFGCGRPNIQIFHKNNQSLSQKFLAWSQAHIERSGHKERHLVAKHWSLKLRPGFLKNISKSMFFSFFIPFIIQNWRKKIDGHVLKKYIVWFW